MPVASLNPRVNITFSSDLAHVIVKAPYDAEFNWALYANSIKSVWIPEGKVRRFKYADYDDVIKLLHDYYEEELG